MRKVSIDDLKVGDTLASDIYCDFSYKTLLTKGTAIKPEHLEKLRQLNPHGYCLFLEDEEVEGFCLDMLSHVHDDKVRRAYLDAFIIGKSIYDNLALGNPINIKLACEAVSVLVEQIVKNSMLLLQLASVRVIDDYTFSHMVNVAIYVAAFGHSLNKSMSEIQDLCLAGLLHDIGKARIPKEILRKPGELTRAEFAEIQHHPQDGYDLLRKYSEISERVRQAVLQHHERGDGSGYPKGLVSGEISLYARMIAIVDVYDALTSDRCYRERLLPHESVEVLMADCATNRLDMDLVKIFLKNIALYPLGVGVVLSDGSRARVKRINNDFPLRPVVDTLAQNEWGEWIAKQEVNLLDHPTLFINQVLA